MLAGVDRISHEPHSLSPLVLCFLRPVLNLVALITSPDPSVRNTALESVCARASGGELLVATAELDAFRRNADNLYERVRALLFLAAIHRFHLPATLPHLAHTIPRSSVALSPGVAAGARGLIPFNSFELLLDRRFEEAIDSLLAQQVREGPSDGISSALAAAYHRLGFQTLADQVRRSVRAVRGNQWMFRMGHPADQPLRIRSELCERGPGGTYPILREQTPVRMDLTHSAWSDIFFLGMDFPEGAKVLNVSVETVMRDWRLAKSWLRRELAGGKPGSEKSHGA